MACCCRSLAAPHSKLDDKTPDEAYWQKPRPGYTVQTGGITPMAFHLISAADLSEQPGPPLYNNRHIVPLQSGTSIVVGVEIDAD